MLRFGPGSWSFNSKTDPRWNCSGRAEIMVISSGTPDEAQKKLEELKSQLGEPPKDLEISCWKD